MGQMVLFCPNVLWSYGLSPALPLLFNSILSLIFSNHRLSPYFMESLLLIRLYFCRKFWISCLNICQHSSTDLSRAYCPFIPLKLSLFNLKTLVLILCPCPLTHLKIYQIVVATSQWIFNHKISY